ncbi:mitochondrial inner membrane translocase subunit TIM44 [Nannizzia gypsea CBS 118893]|uniref:Mitochondrial import inner membrane translocase subunit TIM44 n=1 Tax=Arthroderma gypseum (strain ATCC MYA-4604 / CBS 118893) TaxID=535722 RepID=E4V0T7_ARTGP|nr:mitochondrial inner membrane translocase subunit TIM44 [Nannizzia gypsea CBS 118893]EFR03652.1 mitochondrial inner membrane translocase subunit TIM44 [Nannizzia gypsea CBS 118893]
MIGTGALSQPAAARLVLRGCSPLASTAGARGHLAGRRIITPTALRHFSSQNTIHSTSNPLLPSTTGLSRLSRHANDPLWVILATKKSFHSACILQQQQQQQKQQNPTDSSAEGSAKDQNSKEEPKKEGEEESADSKKEDGKKKEDAPPPPPHGDKTPWQVFTETLRSEFKASKEWNESTKALASSAHQFTESESVRKARSAYETATSTASSTTSSALKKTGTAIGKGAAWTWDTTAVKGIRSGVAATGRGIEQATRPVRETKVYKTAVGNMKEVIDDGSSSRYGGWVEKEERRKRREQRELKEGTQKVEHMEEDPNAGTNVTLHKDAAWKESWREFRDTSPMMQRLFTLKNTYEESENPLISTARSISDRVAGFFAENETAMVIKAFRQMDPNFQIEPFLREMREYILPEVLDAYVKGDVETLKLWLSDAQFHVYAALTKQYKTAGLKSDGRILDIRHVDISHARMLEPGDIPVFIITCRSQEVHVYRKEKTGELAAGMEDKVQLVTYAIGVTRIPDEVNNPETRGWRLIELQKSGRDYI